MSRLLFPRKIFPALSGPARLAAVLWLLSVLAAGTILLIAVLARPAAAADLFAVPPGPATTLPDLLGFIAPAGQPVGMLVALAAITGAIVIGVVGALLIVGAGGHPRRRKA